MTSPNTLQFNHVQIVIASQEEPPFEVQAQVIEQDTTLILAPAVEISYPKESAETLIEQAIDTPSLLPGIVLVKPHSPLQLLAIIHDLDQEPSWREEWIERALHGILRESEQRQLQSIAMPPLGALHGRFSQEKFLVLLHSVLMPVHLVHLKQIWLIAL